MYCYCCVVWSYLQLGADHLEVKLIRIFLQSFLSESGQSVLLLVVVTVGRHKIR